MDLKDRMAFACRYLSDSKVYEHLIPSRENVARFVNIFRQTKWLLNLQTRYGHFISTIKILDKNSVLYVLKYCMKIFFSNT